MSYLATEQCQPLSEPLSLTAMESYLAQLANWSIEEDSILKVFHFEDYMRMLAFIHAVGWMAQQQNHHPEVYFTNHDCTISFTTHRVQALTMNDFICAAKVDALLHPL